MTERYAHYNNNGTVTAKLEITRSGSTEAVGAFIGRHASCVKESFDGAIADAADASFEKMRSRDRAYRYRPCALRVEYAAAEEKHMLTLSVSFVCTSGRQTLFAMAERHRFRLLEKTAVYLGAQK